MKKMQKRDEYTSIHPKMQNMDEYIFIHPKCRIGMNTHLFIPKCRIGMNTHLFIQKRRIGMNTPFIHPKMHTFIHDIAIPSQKKFSNLGISSFNKGRIYHRIFF